MNSVTADIMSTKPTGYESDTDPDGGSSPTAAAICRSPNTTRPTTTAQKLVLNSERLKNTAQRAASNRGANE